MQSHNPPHLNPLQAKAERLIAVIEAIRPAVGFLEELTRDSDDLREAVGNMAADAMSPIRKECLEFLTECIFTSIGEIHLKRMRHLEPEEHAKNVASRALKAAWSTADGGVERVPSAREATATVDLIRLAAQSTTVFAFGPELLRGPAETGRVSDAQVGSKST